jgi:hypothetical protein
MIIEKHERDVPATKRYGRLERAFGTGVWNGRLERAFGTGLKLNLG